MFNRRMFAILALCLCVTTPAAFAGGGGSKKDSTIRVTNSTNSIIAVLVDPTNAQLNTLTNITNPTEADITNAGGKVLNAGATAEFKTRAGSHTIYAGSDVNSAVNTTFTSSRGQTTTYVFNGTSLVLQ